MHFLCFKIKQMDYIKSSNRSQIEMYNLDDIGYFASSDPFFPEYSDPSKSWVVFGYKRIFIIFSRGLESKMRGVNF